MNFLIADKSELFVDGLQHHLPKKTTITKIFDESNFDKVNPENFDLIVIDFDFSKLKGEFIRSIKDKNPEIPLMITTSFIDKMDTTFAIDLGADGIVPKNVPAQNFMNAIQLVLMGGIYLPKELYPVQSKEKITTENPLTPKQSEVLKRICLGQSNKEIANQLNLTEGTVKLHVNAILKALNVQNRTQAVVYAKQTGFLE